jgi:uncharacterized surface protein with fasciclin (FAS1) repeats
MSINFFQQWINYRNAKALVIVGILAILGSILVACSEEAATEEMVEQETMVEQEMAVEATVVVEEVAEEVSKTIVDIAVEDGRFTTLVAALQAAELDSVLAGEGPFTVFAPTDDAFAKLPEGTVASLLETIPALKDILLYHVVSGNVLAADVVTLESATTLQGQTVSVSVMGDVVKINDSQVIITDIQGSNGTIHVIDTVLLPPAE